MGSPGPLVETADPERRERFLPRFAGDHGMIADSPERIGQAKRGSDASPSCDIIKASASMVRESVQMRAVLKRWLNPGRIGCWLVLCFSAVPLSAAEPEPVVRWNFGSEETTPLVPAGGVTRDIPGPRPPKYPDFAPENTAVRLDGNGARLVLDDPGADSPYDFKLGDAITLEAWVQVDEIRSGEAAYIVGKGRTGSPGFARDNQNWALRVREAGGECAVNFLFASTPEPNADKPDAHWHRWTSKGTFLSGRGWHHIAVTYTFGEPDSLRAWIDGAVQTGTWDMGGATKAGPVVDNDAVWVGSSQGGAAGSSLRGAIDSVAIYRHRLDTDVMKTRFHREGPDPAQEPAPEVFPVLTDIPADRVQITFHEGWPAQNRWLYVDEPFPPETDRLAADWFLLQRLPQRYDSWGIRENWKPAVFVRMAADVALPPGKYRFLLRARSLGRLWVDGAVIARTKAMTTARGGEDPVTPVPAPPAPGLRRVAYGQQEVTGEAEVGSSGVCRVVLETLVGGKDFRTDPGELLIAVQKEVGSTWELVQPAGRKASAVALTDAAITAALGRVEAMWLSHDDANRRRVAASQDSFWSQRHDLARKWVADHPAPAVPQAVGPDGTRFAHPVDAFLADRMRRAVEASRGVDPVRAEQFHGRILPVLQSACFRCHGGDKANGGLRLDTREAALRGGASQLPGVVPGKPDESELIVRLTDSDPATRMPPGGQPLPKDQIELLTEWVRSGAEWPAMPVKPEEVALPPVLGDAAFLRRVTLDVIGIPPTAEELAAFLADPASEKRVVAIDRLLADDRWADHWMGYWQDVLAENPTMLNASLNTTGPFRFFLYDSFRDNKPFDRFVTELVLMRGSVHEGGSAGFGIASENDTPAAAKGQVLASAFLGLELQCAKCHDAPFHSTTQKDLFSLAAMLDRKPVTVPKTSRVPAAFFEAKPRDSLIKVTLPHDAAVPPDWPFAAVTGVRNDESLDAFVTAPRDSRERLAALLTSPQNKRFAQVVVNRVWRRYLGAGFVEPAHDWEGHPASHPELLDWLASEFVAHNYDVKHLSRLILTSQLYQREATGENRRAAPERRFFTAPDRRRLTAEQVVDSLFAVTGQPIDVEEMTFDPDARRPSANRLSLGFPRRAWMFASLANERDRPSLSLPRARAVADILEAFGWTGSRQSTRTDRENDPNVLQPGVLANGVASVWLSRAAVGGELARFAVEASSPEQLVDRLFLQLVSRLPTPEERAALVAELAPGFADRLLPADKVGPIAELDPLPRITWSNHLRPEANALALEYEKRARIGPPADPRLQPQWREVYEDVAWSLLNLPEFVWSP